MKILKYHWLFAAIAFVFVAVWYHTHNETKNIYHGDAAGYHAYLPAVVEHGDLSFEQVQQSEETNGIHTNYRIKTEDEIVNKYPIGVSLMVSPFYIAAKLLGSDAFSQNSQWAIVFAALFYAGLGFFFLQKLLLVLNFNPLPVLLIALASNLLYYTIAAPLMNHVYSFFLITLLCFLITTAVKQENHSRLYISALVLALIALVRPADLIVVLFLPFIVSLADPTGFERILKMLRKTIPGSAGIFLTVVFLQSYFWYLQTGRFIVWTYPGEGFNWFSPKLWEIWFGFRKGLFIYAPILLMVFYGIYRMYHSNKRAATAFLFGLITTAYIISCWWDWGYGDGFGQRAYIDFLVFFAIAMAHALSNKTAKRYLIGFAVLSTVLTLSQSYQFHKRILHPNNMSFDKYVYSLFKFGDEYVGCFGGESAPIPHGKTLKHELHSAFSNVLLNGDQFACSTEYISHGFPIRIQYSADKTSVNPINYKETFWVCHGFDAEGNTVFYQAIPFYGIVSESFGKVAHISSQINLPTCYTCKFYVWNKRKLAFKIDKLELDVYELH